MPTGTAPPPAAGCFDALECGSTAWAALSAGPCEVLALQRSLPPEAGVRVTLPEPVAAVQLGAAHGGQDGSALLLLVGSSCRVWALHLRGGSGAGSALSLGVESGVEIAVGQSHCPARHQLAAHVAWEHLALGPCPVVRTCAAIRTLVAGSS